MKYIKKFEKFEFEKNLIQALHNNELMRASKNKASLNEIVKCITLREIRKQKLDKLQLI